MILMSWRQFITFCALVWSAPVVTFFLVFYYIF